MIQCYYQFLCLFYIITLTFFRNYGNFKYFCQLAIHTYICMYVCRVCVYICNIYSDSLTQCYVITVWKANIDFTDSQTIHIFFAKKLILLHLSITTDNT